ncbi:MAG: glycosyltransferase [Kiritimatiellia bacterium]|jgi:glycosyltransferase involved in cell wall biosynthesis|nr:glycosyltransferase [Kiritimatiellia bacterium]MDP6629800.1 glycosyltransferase [Kiritimatiellia bacterium]MDP6809776.1 glycosyltransferase [Kiritimatiellia bacterium]MDP7025114.1 glycosyltransferase [Kiritimatiellia bacterium]
MRIAQILAGYADGDAISEEARLMQRLLREQGHSCELVAPRASTSPRYADDCQPLSGFSADNVDLLIFHYSTASDATALYLAAGCRKVVRYHNITPSAFFRGMDDGVANQLDRAHAQLAEVLQAADAVWSVSDYNAAAFASSLTTPVVTVPLFSEPVATRAEPDPGMLAMLGGGLINFFFVGRIAPNKSIETLIEAFAWYYRCVDAHSRLVLAGSEWSCPRYFALLRLLAARLDLSNVLFLKFVSDEQLAACYASARLFVCASQHEGYCLPLVDAMHYDVPVLASRCGGMPQTLGPGGVLLDEATPRQWCSAMHLLASDDTLRARVLAGQQQRLAELAAPRAEELAALVAGA